MDGGCGRRRRRSSDRRCRRPTGCTRSSPLATVYNLVGASSTAVGPSPTMRPCRAWFVERLGLVVTSAQGTRSEHGRFADRRPDDRPDDDVAGVAHARVYTRVGDRRGQAADGAPTTGIDPPTAPANANADAEWPDGNEVEVGIGTRRASGTPAASRSGRSRLLASFIGRFTTAELIPTAMSPVAAALRPVGPPSANSAAAAPIHSLEWFASPERRRSGPSSVGVGVPAIAR